MKSLEKYLLLQIWVSEQGVYKSLYRLCFNYFRSRCRKKIRQWLPLRKFYVLLEHKNSENFMHL